MLPNVFVPFLSPPFPLFVGATGIESTLLHSGASRLLTVASHRDVALVACVSNTQQVVATRQVSHFSLATSMIALVSSVEAAFHYLHDYPVHYIFRTRQFRIYLISVLDTSLIVMVRQSMNSQICRNIISHSCQALYRLMAALQSISGTYQFG